MKRLFTQITSCAAIGLTLLVISLATASCGSSRKATRTPATVKAHKPGPRASDEVADALVSEARTWLGVPYVYGGTSRQGTDCSGFLVQVYKAAADISLPRTTSEQQTFCAPLKRADVAVGDILFFTSKKSGAKVAHVGMYIGDNKMIHASSSRGVVEDDITLPYYQTHYYGVGRVPQLAAAHSHKNSTGATPSKKKQPEITLEQLNAISTSTHTVSVAQPSPAPRAVRSVSLDSLGSIFSRKETAYADTVAVSIPTVSADTVAVHSRRLPVARRERAQRSQSVAIAQAADSTDSETVETVIVRNAFSKARREKR